MNAAIIRSIFSGEQRGAYRDIVLANAGACIYVGGLAASLTGRREDGSRGLLIPVRRSRSLSS